MIRWIWRPAESVPRARADKLILEALASETGEWSGGEAVKLSRSRLHQLIDEGQVKRNGAPLGASDALRAGDEIEISVPESTAIELVPIDLGLPILFEDAHLAIIVKPAGISVHPSDTDTGPTVVHSLLAQLKDLSGIGGEKRPGIVHRLDKHTSGVLVVAKEDETHRKLTELFSAHALTRKYLAVVYGTPLWGAHEKRVETTIGRHPVDRIRMSIEAKAGKRAVSFFRLREKYSHVGQPSFASLVEAKLETGRTHQVRVHLTHLGHSLLGDPLYGTPSANQAKWKSLPDIVREKTLALSGQALHAFHLAFRHPITGEELAFDVPPAEKMKDLLDTLASFGDKRGL